MSGIRVKEAMEQLHISEEMQEQIIRNLQGRAQEGCGMEEREPGRNRMRKAKQSSFPKGKVAAAAALVLAAGFVGIPVQGFARSFVAARMERIPEAELKDIVRIVYERETEADSFSREFSDSENARYKVLLQAYGDGMFPERTIRLVERVEEMPEGILYYVIQTGYFNLPEREMTDEELLQIIDFNKGRNYALAQSPAGQEGRREYLEKQESMQEQVAAAGGIGREEAVEIAAAQMESRLGAQAAGTKYCYVYLTDMAYEVYAHKADVAYVVVLRSAGGSPPYVCIIDSADGSILEAGENLPYARSILDE